MRLPSGTLRRAQAIGIAALIAGVALASADRNGVAQTTDSATTDQARELMKQGNLHYAKGEWQKAYAAYVAAWALKKHYSIAGNLADVEARLGKYKDAADHFRFYLGELPPGRDADRKRAEQTLSDVRTRIAAATIAANVAGAEILIDGASVGKTPLDTEVFLDPGEHTIEARLERYAPAKQSLLAKRGETHGVALTLIRISPSAEPLPSASADGGKPETPSGPPKAANTSDTGAERGVAPLLIGGAVLVVGLAAGIGFSVAASDKASERDERLDSLPGSAPCGKGTLYPSECAEIKDLDDDHDRFQTFGWIGFGVAGAAVIGAATYWFWPNGERTAHRMTPVVGRDRAALTFGGSF